MLGRSSTLLALALLVPLPPTTAQAVSATPSSLGVTFAVEEAPGRHDLWSTYASVRPRRVLRSVTFLPIRLVGYAVKDRLRLDRPATEGDSASATRVRLTGDGALYRLSQEEHTSLLLVRSDSRPRVLLTVDDGPSGPGLLDAVHLSPDGTLACVATSLEIGGNVYVIELASGDVIKTTAGLPPLDVEPDSLRVSSSGSWFVVGGELYRQDRTAGTDPSIVSLGPDPVDPELALARRFDGVVARTVQSDGKSLLHAVPHAGPVTTVTPQDQEYTGPGYDHPLGPFLAFSPRGDFVGTRTAKDDVHEVFVYPLVSGPQEQHLTDAPEFPGYVDNVGVFAFGQDDVLCFFGGDKKRSGVIPDEEIGAGDMYAADLSVPLAVPPMVNITVTSGDQTPPFKKVSQMRFREAYVGPLGQRIHVLGDTPAGTSKLFFDVAGGFGPQVNAYGEGTTFTADPRLAGSPRGMVSLAEPRDTYPAAWNGCTGDAGSAGAVRILATDKANPADGSARVWFDGVVLLGQEYTLRAVDGGEPRFKNETYLHVFDLNGAVLQTAELETSCDRSLVLGDRFGSSVLVDYYGESELPTGSYDYCEYGERPSALYFEYTGADCSVTSHGQSAGKVTCSGDPAFAPMVDILATDKSDPDDDGAKVWFAGQVALGDSFVVDAGMAGEEHLKNDTYIHVFSPGGALLQDVKVHTECNEPLYAGDLYGSLRLDQCVLESLPPRGDECVSGKPVELTLRYTGQPCGLVPMTPEVRMLPPSSTTPATLSVQGAPLPSGAELERLTVGRSASTAAFVATLANGRQRVYVADLVSCVAREVFEGVAVQGELALLPDERVAFVGDDGTGWALHQARSSGIVTRRALPAAGFPLVP